MAIGTVTSAITHLYKVSNGSKKSSDTKKGITSREESLELSKEGLSASKETKKLEKVVEAAPDIRIPLVEELRAKIRSNDYPIEGNLDELVRKMLRQEGLFSNVA